MPRGRSSSLTPVIKPVLKRRNKMNDAAANIWRIAHFFMFIFFSLATYVQLNDDDACTWLVIYAVPTILTLALAVNPRLSKHGLWIAINFIHTSCCTCFLIYLLIMLLRAMNTDDGSQESTWNVLQYEEGRETVGVILVISWLKLARDTRKRVHTASTNPEDRRMHISVPKLFLMFMFPTVPLVAWGVCFVDGLNRKLGHCSGLVGQCNKT